MPYRNKTYIAFDGDNDMWAYAYMKGWKQNDNIDFNFYDAHDLNNALDTSTEYTIKRKLSDRMNNAKLFILLVGKHTKNLYKFVRWEIETAIKLELPIIVVNLNEKKELDKELCPPIARDTLAIHVPYEKNVIMYSMDNWPEYHKKYKSEGKSGAYYWNDSIYKMLGE
jgi:hypothetical protein